MSSFVRSFQYGFNPGLFCVLLCYIPVFAQFSDLAHLSFLRDILLIEFPSPVIWISGVLLAAMILLPLIEVYRRKKGSHNGKTGAGALVTEGPFRVVRHPEYIGEIGFLLLLTIVLSPIFPFTLVSILSDILVVFAFSILAIKEEKINVEKWGEEYKRYMKEVPRFNFVKGMCNLMRRR